jgi:hypothetical protein
MRGADGVYNYKDADGRGDTWPTGTDSGMSGTPVIPSTSWLYSYTNDMWRADIVDKWNDLDSMYGTPIRTILNLGTTKTTGVEWSGVRSVNTVKVLVSNLSSSSATVDLTPTEYANANSNGLPANTASVAAGAHTMFTYTIANLLGNGQFNTDSVGWYLRTGTTRETSGGISNTACLKMQNNSIGAYGTQNVRTEPGAKMSIKVSAKGSSSPFMKLGYYYYDAAGNNLGYQHTGDHNGITSSWTDYSNTFNVVNNSNVRYIRPVIHNYNSPTDSTDILYIDSVYVKFEA